MPDEEWMVLLALIVLGIIAMYWVVSHLYSMIHRPKSFFQKPTKHVEFKELYYKQSFTEKK